MESHLKGMDFQTRYTFVPDGGESRMAMEERLLNAIDQIISTSSENDAIAIVTHK